MFKFFKRGKPSPSLTKAMITATQAGDVELVKTLIKKNPRLVNTHQNDKEGFTPLRMATINGHAEVVRVLLTHGANIKAKDKWGYTPLLQATIYGRARVADILLAEGAEVDARGTDGHTSLYNAADSGHVEVAELLLAEGAELLIAKVHARMHIEYEGRWT